MRFAAAFLSLLLGAAVQAASPVIEGILPRAVAPRGATRLTITGSNLERATNLWTYFNARARCLTNSAREAVFELADAGALYPAGIWGVQAHGPDGASDFALVLIDSLPGGSKTQQLVPPIAVDGAFASEQADYYRIECGAGQELAIEVLAHRFGSQADPVLRVLDSAGRELAFCDDDDGIWRDARLRFRAPLAGVYTLVLHDVGYGGGNGYPYRLRVGDFRLEPFRFPLGDLTEPAAGAEFDRARDSGSPANPDARIWHSNVPALLEREPNDASERTQEFSPPAIINGRFDSPKDRDIFRFTVSKDQRVIFQRQSRSLGSPCDAMLRVLKLSGEPLAAMEPGSGDDALLKHTFAEGGTFLLELRELTGSAPAGAPYRVRVRNDAGEFRLSTEINKLELAQGASGKFKVLCERLGYEGEIKLECSPLMLENDTIPAGKKEVEIAAKLPGGTQSFVHVTITGRGTNGFETAVSTKPALRKTFPLMLVPPNELDGLIAVARTAK